MIERAIVAAAALLLWVAFSAYIHFAVAPWIPDWLWSAASMCLGCALALYILHGKEIL